MAEVELIISSSSSSSGKLQLGSGSCPIPFLLLHCADANSSVRFWQPHHWLQHLEGSRLIIHQEDYPSDQMFVTLASSAQVAPSLSCVLQCTLPISCLPKNATDGNVELLVTASTQILILEMPFSTNDSMSLSLNVCLGVSGRLLPLPTNLFEDLLLGIEQQNKDFLRGQLSVPRTTTLVVGSTGSGKSSIVRAVATSMKISVLSIGAAQLFARGKQYCDRLLFEMLNAALVLSPCILLLEDIHAFAPRKVLDSSYSAYFEVLQTFLSRLLQNLLPSTSGLWVVATCEKEELLDKHILSLFPDICRIDKMSESNRNKLSTSTGKFYFEALMQKHQGNDKLSNETSRPLEKESEVGTSLVGMCGALASFRQMCIWPRLYRTFYERLGMQRGPSHVLFLGPSGSKPQMKIRKMLSYIL